MRIDANKFHPFKKRARASSCRTDELKTTSDSNQHSGTSVVAPSMFQIAVDARKQSLASAPHGNFGRMRWKLLKNCPDWEPLAQTLGIEPEFPVVFKFVRLDVDPLKPAKTPPVAHFYSEVNVFAAARGTPAAAHLPKLLAAYEIEPASPHPLLEDDEARSFEGHGLFVMHAGYANLEKFLTDYRADGVGSVEPTRGFWQKPACVVLLFRLYRALTDFHAADLAHRDLKLENVALFPRIEGNNSARLGSAKEASSLPDDFDEDAAWIFFSTRVVLLDFGMSVVGGFDALETPEEWRFLQSLEKNQRELNANDALDPVERRKRKFATPAGLERLEPRHPLRMVMHRHVTKLCRDGGGEFVGTPAASSPPRLRLQDKHLPSNMYFESCRIDDAWALGVLTFEILFGTTLLDELESKIGAQFDFKALQRCSHLSVEIAIEFCARHDLPDWAELFRGLLEPDPVRRWTVARALRSPVFDRCRTWHREFDL